MWKWLALALVLTGCPNKVDGIIEVEPREDCKMNCGPSDVGANLDAGHIDSSSDVPELHYLDALVVPEWPRPTVDASTPDSSEVDAGMLDSGMPEQCHHSCAQDHHACIQSCGRSRSGRDCRHSCQGGHMACHTDCHEGIDAETRHL